jgi:predicted MFS family arabinose efflux permease
MNASLPFSTPVVSPGLKVGPVAVLPDRMSGAGASVPAAASLAPVYWLALGTFAVGTEGFMIAAVLPRIARDLAVSLSAAGQLVTIFALTYALSSPVLTALTGGINRRKLLIYAMAVFAVGNLVAAEATGYGSLAGARILLALAAGLYVPGAAALAGSLVPLERRGRALSIVTGGFGAAVALGVPLGAFVGNQFGWRTTFLGVAGLGALALVGVMVGIPRGAGSGIPAASLRERAAVAREPAVLSALLTTTLWGMGAYSVYTYIAPYLARVTGLEGTRIGIIVFLFGASALAGLLSGGVVIDRIGSRRVIVGALGVMAVAILSLSFSAWYLAPPAALVAVMVAVVLWGFFGWAFFPAQQARLIGLTGLKSASIVLSLNASFQYIGFSLGAFLGSRVLSQGGVADLGWAGALCTVAAFGPFLVGIRLERGRA